MNKWFNKIYRHKSFKILLCLFVVFFMVLENLVSQQNNQNSEVKTKKVYLIHADTLDFNKKISAEYHVLRGNVQFRQDSAYMYCYSA